MCGQFRPKRTNQIEDIVLSNPIISTYFNYLNWSGALCLSILNAWRPALLADVDGFLFEGFLREHQLSKNRNDRNPNDNQA